MLTKEECLKALCRIQCRYYENVDSSMTFDEVLEKVVIVDESRSI